MYKACKTSSIYKPTKIARKKNIIQKPPGSSGQLKQAAEQAGHSIETAIAAMTTLPAHDTRKDVPLEHMRQYNSSIALLTDDIRCLWNIAIEAYVEAPPLRPESRSPSPLLDLLTTSNTDSSISSPARGYRLDYRSSGSVEF